MLYGLDAPQFGQIAAPCGNGALQLVQFIKTPIIPVIRAHKKASTPIKIDTIST